MNKQRQRGVALSGLIFWGIIIAVVAMLGIKVAPEVIDYYKIKKSVKSTALNASGKTVPEIRSAYDKYAEVEHIKTITPADLDISKEGNDVVIAFAYEKRIPLFYNVSLLIDFEGSASGRDRD
ncbi:MAG: DUF4845 domain-containing protein [Propionivibrio sp.]|nr:DUF4845 domain-containing protein [Propionivibrio sp.]